MNDPLDITTDRETPAQIAGWGEALQRAARQQKHVVWPPEFRSGDAADDPNRPLHPVLESALNQPGVASTAAAREMIHTMQRRRRQAEERTHHRELVTIVGLALLGSALAAVALWGPTALTSIAVTALVATCGVAVGVELRSRL